MSMYDIISKYKQVRNIQLALHYAIQLSQDFVQMVLIRNTKDLSCFIGRYLKRYQKLGHFKNSDLGQLEVT